MENILDNWINRFATGILAIVAVSLIAYVISTPGEQTAEALIGGALFSISWIIRD